MADVTIPGVEAADVAVGRRPRNRKQTIAAVAATLFAEHGFSAVRMDDIATATGVTVRALYRHFKNKRALLTELVETSQDRFLEAVQATDDATDPAQRFTHAVERLARASKETAHFDVLWQRESRHLDPADYDRVRRRLTGMVGSISDLVGQVEPTLSPFQRELRAWAIITVMVAPREDLEGLQPVVSAAKALVAPARPGTVHATVIDAAALAADPETSRRERILASAAIAFSRTGFAAAGIEEVGNAAGVTGPSLYRHFGSKTELLETLARRREDWLWYEANLRHRPEADPSDRLRSLTEAFVAASVRAPEIVGIWVTERTHLPDPVRQSVGTSINAFHTAWSAALQRARPDLPVAAASRRIALAVQIVEDAVRIRHLHRQPAIAAELAAVVELLLLQPGDTPPE